LFNKSVKYEDNKLLTGKPEIEMTEIIMVDELILVWFENFVRMLLILKTSNLFSKTIDADLKTSKFVYI